MWELWIPVFFIIVFLFLALIRPWIKTLVFQAGIVWLPLAAFIISIGLFPAYGFRPEVLPLVVYTGVLTLAHLPFMYSRRLKRGAGSSDLSKKRPLQGFIGIVLLVFCSSLIFFFSPLEYAESETNAAYSLVFSDRNRNIDFDVKVFGGERGPRPLLILSPPVFGAPALDRVCVELKERGFTVLAFTRRGGNAAEVLTFIRALARGTKSASGNAAGKSLEDAKLGDFSFILDQISRNPGLGGEIRLFDIASPGDIFLGGYDVSSGSAILLAGRDDFIQYWPQVKGIIAVEPRLWSLYRAEERSLEILPPESSWFKSVSSGLARWFSGLRPKRITGLAEIPALGIPVLFLVSDRILEKASGHYEAIYACLGSAKKISVLAARSGAGPFDYAGFPSWYPLVSFLWRGRAHIPEEVNRRRAAPETAQIISNFASLLLEAGIPGGGSSRSVLPSRASLPRDTYIETRSWILPPLGLY